MGLLQKLGKLKSAADAGAQLGFFFFLGKLKIKIAYIRKKPAEKQLNLKLIFSRGIIRL